MESQKERIGKSLNQSKHCLLNAQFLLSFLVNLLTSVYLIKCLPSLVLKRVFPCKCLLGQTPSYSHLFVFGCLCFVDLLPMSRPSYPCKQPNACSLDIVNENVGLQYYDPTSQRICISQHVIFVKHIPFYSLRSDLRSPHFTYLPLFPPSYSSPLTKSMPNESHLPLLHLLFDCPSVLDPSVPSNYSPKPQTLRRSTGISKTPDRYGFTVLFTTLDFVPIPYSYSQAIKEPWWQKAMVEELIALDANQTWDIVPLPGEASVIVSKWIYTIEVKFDGSLDGYKAWLGAHGYK